MLFSRLTGSGMQKRLCTAVLLLSGLLLFSQEKDVADTYAERVRENTKEIFSKPDAAFVETESLLEEALARKDKDSELMLVNNQCAYFSIKRDFKKLIETAQLLQNRAAVHKNEYYRALSYIYLAHAYAFNNLGDRSTAYLEKGLSLVDKSALDEITKITLKGKFYTEYANIQVLNNDPQGQVRYMLLAMEEHDKLEESELKDYLAFRDYSNLAASYYEIDLATAKDYAQQALEMFGNNLQDNVLTFTNFLVIGTALKAEQDYEGALVYYRKADSIKENKSYINLAELYEQLIDTYRSLGDSVQVNKYRSELNELKLQIAENQNESLHKIIADIDNENKGKGWWLYIAISVLAALLTALLFGWVYRRKSRVLKIQEAASQKALKEKPLDREQAYKDLTTAIADRNPTFLFLFEQMFPVFNEKLKAHYPKISKSESEFCALIKIKLTTKEIAHYKSIHYRSVQNRKYRIRKKLTIPKEVDIYDWFDEF